MLRAVINSNKVRNSFIVFFLGLVGLGVPVAFPADFIVPKSSLDPLVACDGGHRLKHVSCNSATDCLFVATKSVFVTYLVWIYFGISKPNMQVVFFKITVVNQLANLNWEGFPVSHSLVKPEPMPGVSNCSESFATDKWRKGPSKNLTSPLPSYFHD